MSEITNPKHYQHPSGVECITVAKWHDFCIGNVLKYLWRAGLKEGETELKDLLKAREYLDIKIKELQKVQPTQTTHTLWH